MPDKNEAAKALARLRWAKAKPKTITCPICGTTKETVSTNAKYCSNKCRQKAKRLKEKEAK